MTKKLLTGLVIGAAFILNASPALASSLSFNKFNIIVANYDTGPHGIAGIPYFHEGKDVVMRVGTSGNFEQWFYGKREGLSGKTLVHSAWKVSEDGSCKDGWVLVPDAHPEWGDYLKPGVNYCVWNDYLNFNTLGK